MQYTRAYIVYTFRMNNTTGMISFIIIFNSRFLEGGFIIILFISGVGKKEIDL